MSGDTPDIDGRNLPPCVWVNQAQRMVALVRNQHQRLAGIVISGSDGNIGGHSNNQN